MSTGTLLLDTRSGGAALLKCQGGLSQTSGPFRRQTLKGLVRLLAYIIRRLINLIPLLLGITVLSFIIINLAPGDFLSEQRLNPEISQETLDTLEAQFGLDQPVYVQYFRWLGNVLRLDFGYSFAYKVPVFDLIGSRLLNTLLLTAVAMAISWGLAIPIGIHAATHKYAWSDKVLTVFAFMGLSMPGFFLALLVLYLIVALQLPLPVGGMTSIDFDYMGFGEKAADLGKHLLIPALVLGTEGMAGIMRQMRGNLLDVLRLDYVTTARSKGLSERVVVYKHAVRNAINPLITLLGFWLSSLISGAALIEIMTSWPGLGRLMLDALLAKDVYLVMGSLVMSSVLLVLGNLFADIMLAVVDPRIRYN